MIWMASTTSIPAATTQGSRTQFASNRGVTLATSVSACAQRASKPTLHQTTTIYPQTPPPRSAVPCVSRNIIIPFTIVSILGQALFRWSFRRNSRKLLQKKWKMAGKFVTVQNAAALCMQAHFRKHSTLVYHFKQHVYAIVLQSAFRGANSRRQLKSHASFGTVAMAAHRDAQLQNATSHLNRAGKHQEELKQLRAQRSSLCLASVSSESLISQLDTPSSPDLV